MESDLPLLNKVPVPKYELLLILFANAQTFLSLKVLWKNTITLFGNGERESSFIEINKLVQTIELFIEHEISGVYNVGDDNLSYFKLAKKIVEQYGNAESKIVKHPNGNKGKFNLDTTKLQKILFI